MFGRRLTASMSLMLLVLLAISMSTAVMFHDAWSGWRQELDDIRIETEQMAETAAARQRSITQTTRMLLTSLAVSPLAQKGNEHTLDLFLSDLLLKDPVYYSFWVFNLDGSCPVFATRDQSNPPSPKIIRERPSFKNALATRHFAVGKLFYSNPDIPTLPMTIPVFNSQGTIDRIIMATLDLRHYDDYFQSLTQSTNSTLVLVDVDKTRLYHTSKLRSVTVGSQVITPELLRTLEKYSRQDLFKALDPLGKQRLFAVRGIEYSGLSPEEKPYAYAVAITSEPTFYSFLTHNYLYELFAIIGSLCFALLVARTTGYLLFTKGLQRMAFVAQNSSANQLALRNGAITGCKEIQTVARAYDDLLDILTGYTTKLNEKRERLDLALKAANLGTWVWNAQNKTLDLDSRSTEILGYPPEQQLVHNLHAVRDLIHPDDRLAFDKSLLACEDSPHTYQAEIRFQHVDGHWVWLLLVGQSSGNSPASDSEPVNADDAQIMFGICMDITMRKKAEELLRQNSEHYRSLSNTDPLTGLWNRRYCEERAVEEIQRAVRYQHAFSLCMCDLDHFKLVNDSYGHHAGDAVLKHFAHTLQRYLRNTDGIARYGGEEFTLLLPECKADSALLALEKVRAAFESTPLQIKDTVIPCTVSLGFRTVEFWEGGSLWIQNASTVEQHSPQQIFTIPTESDTRQIFRILQQQADTALYAAKKSGRNRIVQWQPDMDAEK